MDQKKNDDTLMFHLAKPRMSNIKFSKDSNSHDYIRRVIKRIREDYDKTSKRIGFVGNEDTVVAFLVMLLEGFEKNKNDLSLPHLDYFIGQTNFENSPPDQDP